MGLLDFLTGKKDQNIVQTNTSTLSPEAQKLFDLGQPYIEQFGQTAVTPYTGSTVPDFNQTQIQAQNQALNASGVQQQIANQAYGNSQFFTPNILDPNTNPYTQQVAQAATQPIIDALLQNILPNIRNTSIGNSGFTAGNQSRRGIAEGIASGRALDAVGNTTGRIYDNAYNTGVNALLQSQNQIPIVQNAQTTPAVTTGAVGAQQHQLATAQANEDSTLHYLQQWLPFIQGSELMKLASGLGGGTSTTTVNPAIPSKNPLAGAAGGALSGAALGSAIPGIGTLIGGALGAIAGGFA